MLGLGHTEWDPTLFEEERKIVFDDDMDVDEEVRYESEGDEEAAEEEDMDLEKDDEEDSLPTVFVPFSTATTPTPYLEWNEAKTHYRYTRIPPTMGTLLPAVLKGMSVIKEVSVRSKLSVCVQTAMPMPVHTAPIIALLAQKTTDQMWKPHYTGWMMSCFQLHEYFQATVQGLIPFHPTMTVEKIERAKNYLASQTNALIMRQEDLIDTLIEHIATQDRKVTRQALETFMTYCIDYSFDYMDIYVHFLYTTLVEPHSGTEITLEDVLTPRVQPSLHECDDPYSVRQQVVDFFQTKVPAIDKRIQEQEEFEPSTVMDLKQLPFRIQVDQKSKQIRYNCPKESVYRGYIDMLTIEEYFRYVDREGKLKNIGTE